MTSNDAQELSKELREQITERVDTTWDLIYESDEWLPILQSFGEAVAALAIREERRRLADIFDQTESDTWRAHEVRDYLTMQNTR